MSQLNSIIPQDKLFESAFHYAAIGIALVGLDGRWLKTNAALSQMVGYTQVELLEIDFQTMTYADDLDADLEHVNDLLAGRQQSYQMEKRYIHKNGHIIWGLLSVSLVSKEDGTPDFFISQIQDITARKIAEAERDAFFAQSVDLLAIADRKGFLIEVNPAWTATLGWSTQELTSKPFIEFLHPDDLTRTQQEAERIYQGIEPTQQFCNRYITKDGNYRCLEWNTSDFSADRLYCCVRDVTERVEADEALRLSELRFQDLAANVPGMVYQFEWHSADHNKFTYVSPKVADILGISPEALLANTSAANSLIHPDDVVGYLQSLEQCSRTLSYRYWEGRHVLHDGRVVWTSLSSMPRKLSNGGVLWTGLLQDITSQKMLNQKIVDSENLYRSLVGSLAEGVMLVSDSGEILACNQSAQDILSLSEAQIMGDSATDTRWNLMQEDCSPVAYEDRPSRIAIRTGKAIRSSILGLEIPDKGLRWLSTSAEPLFKDGETKPYASVTSFFDVTDVKELNEKLERQARTDFLTGAHSRGYFYELASIELSRAQRYGNTFALMILDIDHFKTINDQYGHDAGDRALKMFVEVLKQTLRDIDMVGRFGGEEFVVLLPEASIQNAAIIAERIRQLISHQQIQADVEQSFNMTVSIGLAELVEGVDSVDEIIKLADKALYQAKQAGRNQVFYQKR
ncbi:MAG TPA: PAS domain S-box protein [Methylophilaceae bacterium]|nr:PAS domain S-box protein [Methylophilaceae bacterium]